MKKQMTPKERGKVAWLSILAILSGVGIAISLIAFIGSEYNLGALIAFAVSVGLCTWSIIEASKIQKDIDTRFDLTTPEIVGSQKFGMHCEKCGSEIAKEAKFCGTCGYKVIEATTPVSSNGYNAAGRRCKKCGGHNIQYQTVSESKKTGCGIIFLYIILACTILGLLVVIPLMLRKKTESVTYAVCQNCGNRWKI